MPSGPRRKSPARPAFLTHAVPLRIEGEYFSAKRTSKNEPPKHRHFSDAVSCGFVEFSLQFWRQKVWMLRGSKIGRSLRGKVFIFVFAQTRIRLPQRKTGPARSADPVVRGYSRYISTARCPCSDEPRGCGRRPCRGRRAARSSCCRRRSAPGTNARWQVPRPRRTRARRAP